MRRDLVRTTVRGEPKRVEITGSDQSLFDLLTRYRYLPSNFIHALKGGSWPYLQRRLRELFDAGYVGKPTQQWETYNCHNKFDVYELGSRVARRQPKFLSYGHELMCCLIRASIELDVRASPSLQLIPWADLVLDPKTPEATRASANPLRIPIGNDTIIPDGEPFVIKRTHYDGSTAFQFFPGFEADCATEPLSPRDMRRSSIERKLAQYAALYESKGHTRHFGAKTFLVPFIATSDIRMSNMIRLARNYPPIFMFKSAPGFAMHGPSPKPVRDLLTGPWKRAAADDYHITAL